MKYKIQNLASFVQNDFERMIEDGIVDENYIKNMIAELHETYDKVIEELNKLRDRSEEILTNYIK
jgi:mannitol/fructose-specific phosphotransferase system IIA component